MEKICEKLPLDSRVLWPHNGGMRGALILSGFWRRRASSSATTMYFGVARAIISSSAAIVKSFLRQFAKIFYNYKVFAGPLPTLVVYAQSPGKSRSFLCNCAQTWKARRADYTVVDRRCQVQFRVIVHKIRSCSLCGVIVRLWKILEDCTKLFLTR